MLRGGKPFSQDRYTGLWLSQINDTLTATENPVSGEADVVIHGLGL